MALDLRQISFTLNILRTNRLILTKLYKTIYTDKIYVGIVSCHFSPNFIYAFILTRSSLGLLHVIFGTFVPVMALDLRQNFISVQCLESKWTEFHMHSY